MNCATSGFGVIGRTFPAWTEDTQANQELAHSSILRTIGRHWRPILAATLLAFVAWLFGHAAYLHLKSWLAQYLIASVSQQTRTHDAAARHEPLTIAAQTALPCSAPLSGRQA
jgi:hypothetical protein